MKKINQLLTIIALCFTLPVQSAVSPLDLSEHENEEEITIIEMQGSIPYINDKSTVNTSFDALNLLSLYVKDSKFFSCSFLDAGLTQAQIKDSNFYESTFTNTEMPSARLNYASFERCTFLGANLFEAEIINTCNFTWSSFSRSDLSYGIIKDTTLQQATFANCDFSKTSVDRVNVDGTFFINCNFRRTTFSNMDFTSSIFENPKFFKATLIHVTFAQNETLCNADFREAKLSHVIFDEADLRGARLTGLRLLKGNSFKNAKIDATTKATQEEIAQLVRLGAIMVPHASNVTFPKSFHPNKENESF